MTKACQWALGAAMLVSLAPLEARADENPTPAPDVAVAPSATPAPTVAPMPVVPVPAAPLPNPVPVVAQAKPAPVSSVPAVNMDASSGGSTTTDHEVVVGSIGLGYLGSSRVGLPLALPVGRGDQAGMFPNDKLNIRQILVPTLGLRKWFSKRYGFEAGLGLSLSGGNRSAEYGAATASIDKETVFAMSVRAGVPITVMDTRHMAFMLIPEATLSFATSNISAEFEENAPPDAKMRGFGVDAGLRAGAEVHFGFIGLPRLSLQAGVGLYLTAQWASATVTNQSLTDTSVSLGFGSAGNPWDIFSGVANMSARYYF